MICAQKYAKGLLEYELLSDGKGFQHNLDRDLHLLIIWQNGRAVEEQILAETLRRFDVLATIEIQWSPEHIDNNFKRFYKHIPTDRVQGKAAQVGAGAFICVLFEDLHPLYQYRQTVSGSIELANVNVLDLKRDSRERCGGYFVHSSGSPDEFFEQAALLFEANQLRDILEGQWRGDRKTLARDLSGSQGWHDFAELFSVLRYSSSYVVLRNFEFLPDAFFENDKDVDILCANSIDLRLAANATVRDQVEGCVKLNIKVAGVDVPFDVRRVGDDYYDANWQRAILKHRTCGAGGIFRPRDDDYFFSLYYHTLLQKPAVKPVYTERLLKLSEHLGLDFVDPQRLLDPLSAARILAGFLKANGYSYVAPKDAEVYQNRAIIKHMGIEIGGAKRGRLLHILRLLTPLELRKYIPLRLKRLILGLTR